VQRLRGAGLDSPEIDARRIVEQASGFEGSEFHQSLGRPATVRGVTALDAMVERRLGGEPLQYVVGRWGFRQLDLMVDARVLIPRPETEVVAGHAIDELSRLVTTRRAGSPPTAVDLGTGSGAIGLSIACEIRGAQVWLTDASAEAVMVARANLAGLGRAAVGVQVVEGTWFEALPAAGRGRLDLVVSNPPYVRADEKLPDVVAKWEPRQALVPGPSGLEAYDVLVPGAAEWLAPHGALVLECAPDQVATLIERCEEVGFDEVEAFEDLAGRPRGIIARHPS
jgi:release factor glutamine methyltransferase